MTEERELLRGCLAGEREAWDAFVVQYSRLIYGTIKQTLQLHHVEANQSVVEDLVQDVFLSVLRDDFKKLRQFRGDRGCSLASWLRMVATRLTIDFLRKTTVRDTVVNDPEPPYTTAPADEVIRQETVKLIAQAIEALPAVDRLLIELAFKQERSPEEIALILRTSVNAVYTRKSRVLARLKAAIDRAELL